MAKKTTKKLSKVKTSSPKQSISTRPDITSSMGTSYDIQMLITVLLLFIMYPIGLILMWTWMKTWPVWLKIIITLPLFLGILVASLIMTVLGRAIHNARYQRMMYQYQLQMTPSPSPVMQITPSSTPSSY